MRFGTLPRRVRLPPISRSRVAVLGAALSVASITACTRTDRNFPALESGLGEPRALTVGPKGRLLIACAQPNAVFEISGHLLSVVRIDARPKQTGPIWLNTGREPSFDGIAQCLDGSLYLSAGREVVRETMPGVWTAIAAPSGPAPLRPAGLACDRQSRLVIADAGGHSIWRFDPGRPSLERVAGVGLPGDSGDGGPALAARFLSPESVSVASDGSVFIADRGNRRIRRVRPDQTIEAVRAAGIEGDRGPSPALVDPSGVSALSPSTLLVADAGAHRVYRLDLRTTRLTAIAGDGTSGFSGDSGPGTRARLRSPSALAVGPDGAVLVADAGNRRVRRIAQSGVIRTVAGNGGVGYVGDGGPARLARVVPGKLALDAAGNLYVSEPSEHRVRRIDAKTGTIGTVAGNGAAGGAGDGGPASQAELNTPGTIAMGPDNALYIADTENRRIRRVSQDGMISTLTGGWNDSCCRAGGLAVVDGHSVLIADDYALYQLALPRGDRTIVWSRNPQGKPTRLKSGDLERIDAMAALTLREVYVSSFRPAVLKQLDLQSGQVQALFDERLAAPGSRLISAPLALALAGRDRLLVGDFWGPELLALDVRSGVSTAVLSRASPGSSPRPTRVGGLAASEDGTTYVSDGTRIFRIRPGAAQPELIAGEGRGF